MPGLVSQAERPCIPNLVCRVSKNPVRPKNLQGTWQVCTAEDFHLNRRVLELVLPEPGEAA